MNINDLREISDKATQKISDAFSKHPVFEHIHSAMLKAAKAGKYNICLNFNECLSLCGCADFPLDDARIYFTLHGFRFQTKNSLANLTNTHIIIDWAQD